jgi:hypothetical protein
LKRKGKETYKHDMTKEKEGGTPKGLVKEQSNLYLKQRADTYPKTSPFTRVGVDVDVRKKSASFSGTEGSMAGMLK